MSIRLIVSEKIGFLWKIRENFSLGCHSERKNYVAQKIFIPQSCDGQIICSVDCREQNGISSFSMLPMVWAADPRKWNFSVSGTYFWDEILWILAKLLVLDKNVQLKSCRYSKNNGSLFRIVFLSACSFLRKMDFSWKCVENFSYDPSKLIFWSISQKILVWQWSHGQMFCSLDINEEISYSPLDSKSHTFGSRP